MRTRDQRRHANQVKKQKYERIFKARKKLYPDFGQTEAVTDKQIGRFANVHGAVCSCPMCGNPRRSRLFKTKYRKTAQEKRAHWKARDHR